MFLFLFFNGIKQLLGLCQLVRGRVQLLLWWELEVQRARKDGDQIQRRRLQRLSHHGLKDGPREDGRHESIPNKRADKTRCDQRHRFPSKRVVRKRSQV